jgi:hypothetical protein
LALNAEKKMAGTALNWLKTTLVEKKDDSKLAEEIQFWINHYKAHDDHTLVHDEEAEMVEDVALQLELIEVEKNQLMELWGRDEINLVVRNQLLGKLDHRAKHLKS